MKGVRLFSYGLYALGTYVLCGIFLNIVQVDLVPGQMLWSSFNIASFYIPLSIFGFAYLLTSTRFNIEYLIKICLGFLPFLTLSVLLKIILRQSSILNDFLSQTLNFQTQILITIIFLLSQIALIFNRSLLENLINIIKVGTKGIFYENDKSGRSFADLDGDSLNPGIHARARQPVAHPDKVDPIDFPPLNKQIDPNTNNERRSTTWDWSTPNKSNAPYFQDPSLAPKPRRSAAPEAQTMAQETTGADATDKEANFSPDPAFDYLNESAPDTESLENINTSGVSADILEIMQPINYSRSASNSIDSDNDMAPNEEEIAVLQGLENMHQLYVDKEGTAVHEREDFSDKEEYTAPSAAAYSSEFSYEDETEIIKNLDPDNFRPPIELEDENSNIDINPITYREAEKEPADYKPLATWQEDPNIIAGQAADFNYPKRQWTNYKVNIRDLLKSKDSSDNTDQQIDFKTEKDAKILISTLKEFKIEAQVTNITKGPTITQYEIVPAPGIRLSKIESLADNLAMRLASKTIRVVAPIPGKQAVGIEIPNSHRTVVSFSSLMNSAEMRVLNASGAALPVVIGKDIGGKTEIADLRRMPHLLIAGSTGSGKSVAVNSLICSLISNRSPEQMRLLLIDPKIVELKLYNDIPHLLTPVITEAKRAIQSLNWCLGEMERRYSMLNALGTRDIDTYNQKIISKEMTSPKMEYIVIIIDEFADLMALTGKDLERMIARLAAMSRAVGMHLVLATQRPDAKVITGLIKTNLPSRIAFMVASNTDSGIIIGSSGAEKLLGRGDMLFHASWNPFPIRLQGPFLSEEDAELIINHIKKLGKPNYIDETMFIETEEANQFDESSDDMYDKALEICIAAGNASASFLQRKLSIGYNRAARIVEEMEERGIVGPANGSKPRDLLHIP